MGFREWASAMFSGRKNVTLKDCPSIDLSAEVAYKRIAIETCVDLIAKAISRCEFRTFENGATVRKNNYYALNVEPNQNQNATEFWYKVISKLLNETESLIVMVDNNYLIADSYGVKEYALFPNQYTDVTVGDLRFDRTFYESEVLHFKLSDSSIVEAINSLYESYGKLLSSTINYYKRKNNRRWFASANMIRAQDDETQRQVDAMLQSQLQDWFDPNKEAVVFQKQKGYEMENASDAQNGAKSDSSDIRAMIDDIVNFVAMAFHVPRAMLKGDIADVEANVDSFIMFALNPIAELIADEFNRKVYKKDGFLQRSYMQVMTSQIKLINLTELANSLDKMFAIGGYTIDEVLEELGKNPTGELWANERYITKNYQKARLADLEGGENE